jgi:FkbM family methyltransferase
MIGPSMSYVSSAQNQEDILLWRALRQVKDGFYVDVGAADPVSLSVTRLFYEQGWHGINLEPNATYFATLSKARPRDINLPLGAGKDAGQHTFYNVGESGLSTFDPAIAATHKANGWTVTEHTIETLTLAEICRRHRPEGPIHFLKIDVEGTEYDVLAGADFAAFRPWIVLVEAMAPGLLNASYAEWEHLLVGQGYSFVWYDGLNRFYVADEKKAELEQYFQVQPNIFDGFIPSYDFLARAEHAEQSLHEMRAQAAATARETAETVRHTSEALRQTATALADLSGQTAEAQRRTGELETRLAEVRDQHATALADLSGQTAEAHRRAGELETRLAEVHHQHATALADLSGQTAEAQRRAGESETRLAEAQDQHAILSRRYDEIRSALLATEQRLQQILIDHAQMQRHAEATEARVKAILTSSSWRISAPYRYVGRLVRAEARPRASALVGKALARRIFHRSMRRLLAIPGMRRGVGLVYRLAPGPVEWLALRYRAYERQPPVLPEIMQTPAAVMAPAVLLDLGDDEARLLRQFATNRAAAAMTA